MALKPSTAAKLKRFLALFQIRMGSFSSSHQQKIPNNDTQDNNIELPRNCNNNRHQLLDFCHNQTKAHPMLKRDFEYVTNNGHFGSAKNSFRVLQWNILSQALGEQNDNFSKCPLDALAWNSRKYQIIEEILEYNPDVVCLQEVDHFNFLRQILATQGYQGVFYPKPDSPCMYIRNNNGPDGCAIFYRVKRMTAVSWHSHVLHIWRMPTNQVALLVNLRDAVTGRDLTVTTTHLKARNGTLLAQMRHEQGKDLLRFVTEYGGGRPVVICGDFNAEPVEPIYRTVLNDSRLGRMRSAYGEPPYTTWKIRDVEGEICHTVDYVFYAAESLTVDAILRLPTAEQIGVDRLPSYTYPSDHCSLICDFYHH